MSNEIITNPINSFDNKLQILNMEAPITLRMLISFFLRCAVNAANPNMPRHEMRIAMPAKYSDKAATRHSEHGPTLLKGQ